MNDSVSQCARLIQESRYIAALTGAGISTSAGIPDFRGPQGLYVTRRYDPDTVFDINYFYHDPKPFYEFARDFLLLEEKINPTFAHKFLSDLEKTGNLKGVVTQNIDSLHQRAGSQKVYEMHGSFSLSHCLKCRKEFSFTQMKEKLAEEDIPRCACPASCGACGGVLKPDIVFFGENVKCLAESEDLAARSDLFFVIGTSCVVYPAAMIPQYVQGKIVVVNQDPVSLDAGNVVLTVREDIDAFFARVAEQLGYRI
ncbi:MAG: RNA polymerase subunit sigma [Omnitrophica WOR_2 bacterium RIFCSPLOWO2_12_FULL_50_9]|nr:MAG: RNA polymerase subunit sigma [Omnitrophica WOR_2 bacterium RIFCSPHIGHO2_02_FULL_50_17]OGX43428.1 MAG: RNA polymerase subunit sigma [Omnitrophica WOR_2 bacterium RIFCSPLOWO2_12_FULL_50_9]